MMHMYSTTQPDSYPSLDNMMGMMNGMMQGSGNMMGLGGSWMWFWTIIGFIFLTLLIILLVLLIVKLSTKS